MTKQTASPSDIAHGAVVTEIATAGAAAEMAAVPEWIKILPAGKVTTRDGRFFIFDAEALAARFNADGIDIPVDLDHGISKNDKPAAVGWIKEMAAKPDGLYGRVDWLDAGKKVLAEKAGASFPRLSLTPRKARPFGCIPSLLWRLRHSPCRRLLTLLPRLQQRKIRCRSSLLPRP